MLFVVYFHLNKRRSELEKRSRSGVFIIIGKVRVKENNGCRCDERLKSKTEGAKRLGYTG